jgi:hypothetical protein
MLERRKDRKSLQNLVTRFRESRIQSAIDRAEVDDETFNGLLEEILGEEEGAFAASRVREDAGFAEFDRALGEMAKAEDAGSGEDVAKLEEDIAKAIRAEKLREA